MKAALLGLFKQFQPYPFWADPLLRSRLRSGFPIPDLTIAVQNALRLFIPDPKYCFSDTAGTTPAVKDGNVALWKEATGKPISASQATTGFQPKLRKGAKNWLTNSILLGAVSGSPGTVPTGSTVLVRGGLTRTITATQEVVDGVLMPVLYVRWQGTSTDAGEIGFDWNTIFSNSIPVTTGQLWEYSCFQRLVAGTLPSSFNLQIVGRASGGDFVEIGTVTANLTSLWQRFDVSKSINNSSSEFITAQNRCALPVGTSIDVTVGFAAPQLERDVTAPSVYAPTAGAFASNGIGPWWLDFDGVQSRLELSSPAFNGGQSGWTSAAVAVDLSQKVNGAVLSTTLSSNTTSTLSSLVFEPAFKRVSVHARNDAGSSLVLRFSLNTNINTVYSIQSDGTSATIRTRGVNRATQPLPALPVTTNISTIGAFRRSSSTNTFYRGGIYGISFGEIPVTDAELLGVELYLGRLMGITL